MKIAVLMKEVPDTYGDRVLSLETGLADRGAGDVVLDEITERALEVALVNAANIPDAEIVVLTVGPATATTSIRRALAIGAGSAVHIADEELIGADLALTAEVLAAGVKHIGADLVLTGNLSTDGSGGVIPAMLAELLGFTQLTALTSVTITADGVTGVRTSDDGVQEVSGGLPAVVSITEALPEARFPNFKGIMAAKKKPMEVLSLADLGVVADPVAEPHAIMIDVAQKPPRQAGTKIEDDGQAAQKLVDYLVQNRLV